MTMFTAFTEQFRKQDICLFSDFIADTAPFGVVPSLTTSLSTFAFSNTNTDTQQANQPLGTMTMAVPTVSNALTAFPAIGVYPAAAIAAGGAVNRDFRVGRGEIDFEARLRTVSNNANIIVTFGIGLPSDAAPPVIATHFVGFFAFGDQVNWTAAMVINSTVVRSVATNVNKNVFADFRVFLDHDANRAKVYANGALVATFDGQLPTNAGLLPHIEIRDRTQTGSLAASQSVEADYMLVKLKAPR